MNTEVMIMVANILQGWGVTLLSLVAYIPQWQKLIKTKSSEDISLKSWLIWTASTSFAVFYAVVQYWVNGHGAALVFSSVTGLLFILVTVYLVLVYRR